MYRLPTSGSLIVVLAMVALGGCGGSGDDSSTISPGQLNDAIQKTNRQTRHLKYPEQAGKPGPHGTAGVDHIGPVAVGMSMQKVKELFGAPNLAERSPKGGRGCPLKIDWSYDKGTISFGPDGAVAGYLVENGDFKTNYGAGIGAKYKDLKKAFGPDFTSVGSVDPPKHSVFYLEGENRRLTFTLLDGRVDSIAAEPTGCNS